MAFIYKELVCCICYEQLDDIGAFGFICNTCNEGVICSDCMEDRSEQINPTVSADPTIICEDDINYIRCEICKTMNWKYLFDDILYQEFLHWQVNDICYDDENDIYEHNSNTKAKCVAIRNYMYSDDDFTELKVHLDLDTNDFVQINIYNGYVSF